MNIYGSAALATISLIVMLIIFFRFVFWLTEHHPKILERSLMGLGIVLIYLLFLGFFQALV